MNSLYKYILSLLPVLLLGLMSCEDTLLYNSVDIPEGESIVTATIDFHQFDKTNLGSRADGTKYDNIRNLWILVYDEGGNNLLKKRKVAFRSSDNGKTTTDTIGLDFGKYQIYAVANIDDFGTNENYDVSDVDKLKSLRLEWKQDENGEPLLNDEMIGAFSRDNTDPDPTNPNAIVVNRKTVNITAQLIRAASKVTVSYDGSALEEGISVYIRSLSIKRIPTSCFLGNDNTISSKDNLTDGGTVVYHPYADNNYTSSSPTVVNKATPFYPRKDAVVEDQPAYSDSNDPHAHTSTNSLFFYENLQGSHTDIDKCKYLDEDGDGRLDWIFPHERLPYATYIEVDARWESTNPKYPGVTDVKYRFMLGQDIQYDYNVKRNHHYKLTLHLHGYAADPDWRIDYERMLSAPPSHEVDYRGMFLNPDPTKANFDNNFETVKSFTIESYMFPEENPWDDKYRKNVDVNVEFLNEKGESITKPDWLSFTEVTSDKVSKEDAERGVKQYEIRVAQSPAVEKYMNTVLAKSNGTVNLYEANGNTSANCYIVDGSGTYTFPLIYGNAIEEGTPNPKSYVFAEAADYNYWEAAENLPTLLNYQGKGISSPFITTDINKTEGLVPWIVWTDVQNLIDPSTEGGLKYVKNLCKIKYDEGNSPKEVNVDGIQFTINKAVEGNVVIGLKDVQADKFVWSWHIWVTGIDTDFLSTITPRDLVTGKRTPDKKYDIMPVNLGWSSEGGKVTYYHGRSCKVKFTQAAVDGKKQLTQTIDIVQRPFVGVPKGSSPYFQWGRKDPFVGSTASYKNKEWYTEIKDDDGKVSIKKASVNHHLGQTSGNYYSEFYPDNEDKVNPGTRKLTKDVIHLLIQNPDKFYNPRRINYVANSGVDAPIQDDNYSNLWMETRKTVYDPCPAGFQVSPYDTFTGFTFNGWEIGTLQNSSDWPALAAFADKKLAFPTNLYAWFNVTPDNMHEDYKYEDGLFGFYTDDTKTEPVIFTDNGYIDFALVQVLWESRDGHIWVARRSDYSSETPPVYHYTTYFLKYQRKQSYSETIGADVALEIPFIGPATGFHSTNGMCVRPTRLHPNTP